MALKITSQTGSVSTQNKKRPFSSHWQMLENRATFSTIQRWRGGRGQCKEIVLKILLHTFGKTITDCRLAAAVEYSRPHKKKIEIGRSGKERSFRFC